MEGSGINKKQEILPPWCRAGESKWSCWLRNVETGSGQEGQAYIILKATAQECPSMHQLKQTSTIASLQGVPTMRSKLGRQHTEHGEGQVMKL